MAWSASVGAGLGVMAVVVEEGLSVVLRGERSISSLSVGGELLWGVVEPIVANRFLGREESWSSIEFRRGLMGWFSNNSFSL